MTALATALLIPSSLPRCLLAWIVCAVVALMCGVLLMVVDLTGPQWRG